MSSLKERKRLKRSHRHGSQTLDLHPVSVQSNLQKRLRYRRIRKDASDDEEWKGNFPWCANTNDRRTCCKQKIRSLSVT